MPSRKSVASIGVIGNSISPICSTKSVVVAPTSPPVNVAPFANSRLRVVIYDMEARLA
jgi:hypothetical protein